MKNKKLILSLSAAALLAVIVTIVLVRRRGRKVYVKDEYRHNGDVKIWLYSNVEDSDGSQFFQGTLDAVYVPYGAIPVRDSDGYELVPVTAIDYILPDNSTKKVDLKSTQYVLTMYLNL